MLIGFGVVILAACVSFFYKAADYEQQSGLLWAGLSFVTWFVASFVTRWGLWGALLGEVVLFVILAVVIYLRRKKPEIIK